MLIELIVATLMVMLTVVIHGIGIVALSALLRVEAREEAVARAAPLSARAFGATMLLVLGLFALHGVEVWAYAFLYQWLGAVPDLRDAVYFSAITYGAIGYSDAGFATRWQLVAAIEGLNGVILLGWSTAFFVAVVGHMPRWR